MANVSRYRCSGSVLLDKHHIQWFAEGRLQVYKGGVGFGTCLACGRLHHDHVKELKVISQ